MPFKISKGAIGLLLLGLLIGSGIGFAFSYTIIPPTPVSPTPAAGLVGDVPVLALVPLTGALTTYGENSKVATELAVSDVNAWLAETGAKWRLKYIYEDTATDPATALSKLKTWHGRGVVICHSMTSSSELKECKGYADANHILIISSMSSSAALAIPGDYIYRNIPHSLKSCKPIVALMKEAGIKHLIPTWRGDSWGDSFHDAVKNELPQLGIVCHDEYGIRYDPQLTTFTVQAAKLYDAVKALVDSGVPKNEIGIYAMAFDEIALYMAEAAKYPLLREVKWFGTDSSANVDTLIKNTVAGRFAVDVKFINPTYSIGENPKKERVRQYIMKVLGREPDPYAYSAYDVVWYIAIALRMANAYDADAVKELLPSVVANYYGASGWFTLDENGDRAFADYDLWILREVNGTLKWTIAGRWSYITGKTEWIIPIYRQA
jgi:branched-chain amino acid transport system substrate-binding protein